MVARFTVICARVLHDQGLHARIPGDQSRLQASTAEARDGHLLRIMRPKYGLPGRVFSASAQSMALVRSDVSVRGKGFCSVAAACEPGPLSMRPEAALDNRGMPARADESGC